MKVFLLLSAVLALVVAQQTSAPGGNLCNYPATGDESTESAVPIADFRTSGLDFVRPAWCITHCHDRKSLKAAVLFQEANSSSPTYNIRRTYRKNKPVKIEAELVKGTPIKKRDDDPFNFCIDDDISAKIDQIVNQYTDIETMSEALNYYINKPGWAYLIYDMGQPPSIIGTDNVKQDMNYCVKDVNKQLPNGDFQLFQVFSGLVQVQN